MRQGLRQFLRVLILAFLGTAPQNTYSEEIFFDPDFGFPPEPINPGDTIYVYLRLFDNNTPLTGYSLDIDVVPVDTLTARTIGLVSSNPELSTFYPAENLITQGGGALHPLSEIFDPGDGGLFVNAFNKGFTPVNLAGDGHDVFVLTAWDISWDAEGEFMLQIGDGTYLADANARSVPYSWNSLTFEVEFPEPGGLVFMALGCLALKRRRG